MITVKEIREKFPNPTNKLNKPGGYCVGGALCKFVDERICEGFPSYGVIARFDSKSKSGIVWFHSQRQSLASCSKNSCLQRPGRL